ncbi:hypothetical protein E3N88_06922 [Mikania micrantha]|uniref:Uncharacterized protein n=1 Tax=Mikania micrantha TaxID=192012 RepID=A0A5N6PRD5_9ASTR|nr:hypothetical protein E3N88_06922 [Mikania micrantha]
MSDWDDDVPRFGTIGSDRGELGLALVCTREGALVVCTEVGSMVVWGSVVCIEEGSAVVWGSMDILGSLFVFGAVCTKDCVLLYHGSCLNGINRYGSNMYNGFRFGLSSCARAVDFHLR